MNKLWLIIFLIECNDHCVEVVLITPVTMCKSRCTDCCCFPRLWCIDVIRWQCLPRHVLQQQTPWTWLYYLWVCCLICQYNYICTTEQSAMQCIWRLQWNDVEAEVCALSLILAKTAFAASYSSSYWLCRLSWTLVTFVYIGCSELIS